MTRRPGPPAGPNFNRAAALATLEKCCPGLYWYAHRRHLVGNPTSRGLDVEVIVVPPGGTFRYWGYNTVRSDTQWAVFNSLERGEWNFSDDPACLVAAYLKRKSQVALEHAQRLAEWVAASQGGQVEVP